MKAKDIYYLVSARLMDLVDPQRWPWTTPSSEKDVSLEAYLNNALLAVVAQRPDATANVKDLTLVAGVLQELEAEDLTLIDILFALDNTNKPVRTLTRINKQEIDLFTIGWGITEGDIYHWAYEDLITPRKFWVIPGAALGDKIRVVTSIKPVEVSDPEDELLIPLTYKPALVEMILYQVFASDTDDANWQQAVGCLQNYAQIMGMKFQVETNIPFQTKKSEGT
jgi:hypothetical protein